MFDAFIRDKTDEHHSGSFSFRFSRASLGFENHRPPFFLSDYVGLAILVKTERSKLQRLATGRREHTEKSTSRLLSENMVSVETEFTLAKIHLYLNNIFFKLPS